MAGIAADTAPTLGDGDRTGGGEVTPQIAVAFKGTRDRGIVGGTQDEGEVARFEPVRGCEVGRAQRGDERRYLQGIGAGIARDGGRRCRRRSCRGFLTDGNRTAIRRVGVSLAYAEAVLIPVVCRPVPIA